MATLSDVQAALVSLAVSAVYPNGTTQPSVGGVDVMLYQGWPVKEQLDSDLAAGKAHVSVFSTNTERNTTRFGLTWQTVSISPATLVLTAINNQITVSGTVSIPQTCMIIINGMSYTYVVQANDTLLSIASNLAAFIPNATASNTVITILGAYSVRARVSTLGSAVRELKRQERQFILSVWAANPTVRAAIADAIDGELAANYRIVLPDGLYASVKYHGTREEDSNQKSNLYIRHLTYAVEYATTQSENEYTITNPFSTVH